MQKAQLILLEIVYSLNRLQLILRHLMHNLHHHLHFQRFLLHLLHLPHLYSIDRQLQKFL
jgi:hypothetical protein